MNINEVRELLANISDAFVTAKFSPTADITWCRVLEPYPAPDVFRAYDAIARRDPGFPPNAYQIAAELDTVLSGELPPDVIWAGIMQIARDVDRDQRSKAKRLIAEIDPLAAEIVDTSITWWAIANTPSDKNDGLYRRFRDGLLEMRKTKLRSDTQYQSVNGPSGNLPNGIDVGIAQQIARVLGVGDDNYPEVDE